MFLQRLVTLDRLVAAPTLEWWDSFARSVVQLDPVVAKRCRRAKLDHTKRAKILLVSLDLDLLLTTSTRHDGLN